MSDALSVSLQLPAPGTGQPNFYFQNENGSILTPSTPVTTTGTAPNVQDNFTVLKSDLAAGSQGFLLTAYNGTTTSMTPGRGTFPYVLDPAKVGTGVYVLDASANAIWEFSLNEMTGLLTALGSVQLPTGFAPSKFVMDPGMKRLYVLGTMLSTSALTGFTLSSTGALTPITGMPQSSSATFPSGSPLAITTDQELYWASSGSIYAVPIASDGSFSLVSPKVTSGGPSTPDYMSYSLGSNLLFLGSMSNGLSVYQPQAGGSASLVGSLSGVGFVGGNVDVLLADPVLNTVFALIASNYTITPYNYGNNPSFQISTCPTQTVSSSGPLAIDPAGVNLYFAGSYPSGSVSAYSVSTASGTTYGQLSPGASFAIPNGATPRGVATDPLGRYVLTCDSAGNVYVVSFPGGGTPTKVASQTGFATSPNFVDLAAVRFQ
jgi:6-phosphogluconolactonase (cycloisomerase 2 family)